MALRLAVFLEALPGKREEMVAAYAKRCPRVRQEPGCLEFELYQNIENPDRFTLLERWVDADALAAHGARPADPEAEDVQTLRRHLGGERYEVEATGR
jgi:quinol monooxygenase YgiN